MTICDDAVADDQSKADAVTERLNGEKWFENVCLDLRRNTGAIVGDFNEHLSGKRVSSRTDLSTAAVPLLVKSQTTVVAPSPAIYGFL